MGKYPVGSMKERAIQDDTFPYREGRALVIM